MVKDQIKAMYTTLLNNHVQLLELIHEDSKGKELKNEEASRWGSSILYSWWACDCNSYSFNYTTNIR